MKENQIKLFSDKTEAATRKMLDAAKAEYSSDLAFAEEFIKAQYDLILCLVEEKNFLVKYITELQENNIKLMSDMLLSGTDPTTLH